MKYPYSKIILVCASIFAIIGVAYYLNYRYCGFVKEITAYTPDLDNTYYWGPKYCPTLWSFKSMNEKKLNDLTSANDFYIVSQKENTDIEKAVENKYLGYNKITAEGGESSFVIYQISCQSCKK